VPVRVPAVPAGAARARPDQGDRIPAPASREAEGPYYEEANRRSGKTGEELLKILESRLDNVVYRSGYAKSRDMARQLVKHGHFLVNGKKVDIPSFRVKEHDVVEVREKSRDLTPFIVAQAEAGSKIVPAWLESIPTQLKILVHTLPARQVIDTQVQEQLIVELYSK
jgi:small subunit ribosomal protein S4